MNAKSEHNLLLNIFFTTELKDDSVGTILTYPFSFSCFVVGHSVFIILVHHA